MTDTAREPDTLSYHDVHLTPHASRTLVWTVIAEYLAPWVTPRAHVVELGAGYCAWINAVRAARRVAVDVWPGLAREAAPGVEPVVRDLTQGVRGLGEGQFDVVLASNVLEHFAPDVASAIVADAAALLRPAGRLIVIQPNFRYAYRHYFDDYTHRSVFTHVSLAALLRLHGFVTERVEPRFMPYSMRERRWPIAAWMIRAYLRLPFRPWAGQMLIVARKD